MTPPRRNDKADRSPLLVTREEAARRLGLDRISRRPERVVREMVARGELRGVAVGRWVMVESDSIDRWIASR
jgi:excisionase family DNA binding protein